MNIKVGNLWEFAAYLRIVTTNSYITGAGELVMGRGAAYQAARLFRVLPKLAGEVILNTCGHLGCYGFVVFPELAVGLFQVKTHFANDADLDLIRYSALKVREFLAEDPVTLAMNFPGIGNGRLSRNDVQPVLETLLPDLVTVYLQPERAVAQKRYGT